MVESSKTTRTYMVVTDETPEARVALHFAARRAAKTGGAVMVLAIISPPEFVQWSGVQAAMEEEALARVEGLLAQVAGEIFEESGIKPEIFIRQGAAADVVRSFLEEGHHIHALVLGAAEKGPPGPLVSHFAGEAAGQMPCPIMIIPGGLSPQQLDELS